MDDQGIRRACNADAEQEYAEGVQNHFHKLDLVAAVLMTIAPRNGGIGFTPRPWHRSRGQLSRGGKGIVKEM
jgi:hypothetical protein